MIEWLLAGFVRKSQRRRQLPIFVFIKLQIAPLPSRSYSNIPTFQQTSYLRKVMIKVFILREICADPE